MPKTEVRSAQIKDATVGRSDVNIATPGEAVVAKIVAGSGVSISSTGADTGTGDVTVSATGGTPNAHQASHQVGGSDALVNAAWTNQANTFTENQTISKSLPVLTLNNTSSGADFRRFEIVNTSGSLTIRPTSDAGAVQSNALYVTRDNGGTTTAVNLNATGSGGNVACKDQANTFTQIQTISNSGGQITQLALNNPGLAADARRFAIQVDTGALKIAAQSDAGALQAVALTVSRAGSVIAGGDLTATGSGGNVACKDQANTFTQDQKISKSIPRIKIVDTTQVADQRHFEIVHYATEILFQYLNDAETLLMQAPLRLTRAGDAKIAQDVYEKQRTTPMGHWAGFTPSVAATGGPITIDANYNSAYTLIGKTLIVNVYWAITLSAASQIHMGIPGGFTSAIFCGPPCCLGSGFGMIQVTPGSSTIIFYKDVAGTNIQAGAFAIAGSISFQIA